MLLTSVSASRSRTWKRAVSVRQYDRAKPAFAAEIESRVPAIRRQRTNTRELKRHSEETGFDSDGRGKLVCHVEYE
jgi:hypothetical protein